MLSMKAKYGLRAVLRLAKEYGQGPMLIADMAEREDIPRKFLELILLELKNKGILHSKKGKGGGYSLGRKPDAVRLGEVIRLLDGPLAPLPCVSQTAYKPCLDCSDEDTCEIRMVMKDVRDAITEILDGTTLADVIERSDSLVRAKSEALMYHI